LYEKAEDCVSRHTETEVPKFVNNLHKMAAISGITAPITVVKKFTLEQARKVQQGYRDIAPLFL